MLTQEQQDQLIREIEFYNECVVDKTLRDALANDLTVSLALGMISYATTHSGVEEAFRVYPGIAMVVTEAMMIGIWLAEQGKTNLIGKKEVQ